MIMNSEADGIVLFADKDAKYGVYDMLSSFFHGLKKAFDQNNIDVDWATDIKKEASVSIGFNAAGMESWKSILDSGCSNIMWTVDSCFYHDFCRLSEYTLFPRFHILGVTKSDIAPLNYFFPEFKNYHYLPHGVDPDVWKYQNQEKDLDIVYLASVRDPQEMIKTVKEKLPANVFEIFMGLFEYLKLNPYQNIWEIYKEVFLIVDDDDEKMQNVLLFHYFFKNITYLLSYTKRIELVNSMADVGIKVWGNDEWSKYISGKNQYMGAANFEDVIKIIPRSKISLNLQPLQIIDGLHERVLNSALSESAVLCDPAPEIKNTFGDSLNYYDVKNFTNIKQKALSLLANKDLREYKVQKAKSIVLKDHTWASRAKVIQSIISNK